jgi:hypothetical protein
MATNPRLEASLRDGNREQVVLGGLTSPNRSVKTANAFSMDAGTMMCW